MNYKNELISMFENDIDSLIKLVKVVPLLYNSMSMELKKNKRIIENTYIGIDTLGTIGIDFYSVIENNNDKVKAYQEFFDNLQCSKDILKILIIDEYCAEKTTQLLDEYKELVLSDDDLLKDILITCGFIGFLSDLKDNRRFLSRMVKINGGFLLLASDRLKKDRDLILEAINKNPMVVFKLGLLDDDPLVKKAIEMIKAQADKYISLPSLDS